MDDFQIILYIIFVLFAIISRALKKKKQAPPKKSRPAAQNQERPAPKKAMSFEELLREFSEEKSPEPVSLETIDEEEEDFNIRDDDEIQRIYEESIRASQRYEQNTSGEDDRHTGNFKHFEHYSEEDVEEEASEYAKMLQEEDGPRKAVILSEIFNRKY